MLLRTLAACIAGLALMSAGCFHNCCGGSMTTRSASPGCCPPAGVGAPLPPPPPPPGYTPSAYRR